MYYIHGHCFWLYPMHMGPACRQSTEERLKLAKYVHTWRVQYAADKLLKQHPPNFAWFQKQVHLKPLIVTPQGHVVILLKVSCRGSNMQSACSAAD